MTDSFPLDAMNRTLKDNFPVLLDQELAKELGTFLNGGERTTAVIAFGEQLLSNKYHEEARHATITASIGKIPLLMDINFCEALKNTITREKFTSSPATQLKMDLLALHLKSATETV